MMKIILHLLLALLLLFGEIEGTLEDCTANKCLFCLERHTASCDVDLDVMENGNILQYTINCTAPPECVSMPVSDTDRPEYCVVSIFPVGDVGTDTEWQYQAADFQIPRMFSTCEDLVLRHEPRNQFTPDCTALSKNCSTATTSLSECLSQVCFCYNDDCGASIYATVTVFNDTDTTTTSTIPPYTASTTATTSTTSILPSDTNNDSLNDTGTLCSTVPFLNPIFLGLTWHYPVT